jgi:hypothetical protein
VDTPGAASTAHTPARLRPILKKINIVQPRLLSISDIPELRTKWAAKYNDVYGPPPNKLPPWREVNHEIPIKDPQKRYHYHAPRCPDALHSELVEKTNRYVENGMWKPCAARQAMPLLCLFKKNMTLRTAMDTRQRNENTHLDVTPLPDQDIIHDAVARAKFRSKIDMTDAFEQVRIIPEHVQYTTFTSILGTYQSEVMQIGDLNGPSTMQRLMTWVFRERIGVSVFVYLDDIFIYSDTIEQHEDDLEYVLTCLRREELYIAKHKFDVYSECMDCLGHVIDEKGLHATSVSRVLDLT